MRVLLIRHGQTPANVAGSLDTTLPGPGLTDLGLAQADAIPEAVGGEEIGAVFASRALRAQLTATPLAQSLGLPRTSARDMAEKMLIDGAIKAGIVTPGQSD